MDRRQERNPNELIDSARRWRKSNVKRPAIQLYFGDLLKNPNVRRCSWAARGALVWTMSLLHDSDEYGALRWTLMEIAQGIGCPLQLVKELADKNALKGGDRHVPEYRWAPSHAGKRGPEVVLVPEQDGPLWYSSRMVRDEYKRSNRGVGTRFGGTMKLPTGTPTPAPSGTPSRANGDGNGSPNGPPSQREGAGASSSSSSSTMQLTDFAADARTREPSEAPAKSTAGHKNGHENQKLAAITGWMTDDKACEAKAAACGIKPLRGETYAQLRNRIAKHEANGSR